MGRIFSPVIASSVAKNLTMVTPVLAAKAIQNDAVFFGRITLAGTLANVFLISLGGLRCLSRNSVSLSSVKLKLSHKSFNLQSANSFYSGEAGHS